MKKIWFYMLPALVYAFSYPLIALILGLYFIEGLRLPFWLSLPLCDAAAGVSVWLTVRAMRQTSPREIFQLARTISAAQICFAAARCLEVIELLLVVLCCGFAADTPEGARLAEPILLVAVSAVPVTWFSAGWIARTLADRAASLHFFEPTRAADLHQTALVTPFLVTHALAEEVRRYQPDK